MSVEAAKNARELLLKEYRAVLSTHSKKWPGFPFGSVVPYCLDAEGRPLILISRIAQHTHNLQADPRCSMLVGERGAEDIQAVGRLTLLAEARQLAEEEVAAAAERYYRYFPESADYHRVHDFDFWVLQPVQWRFIGGFGAIHWLAAERVPLANPFAGEAERGMVEHMNSDHAAAIAHYVDWTLFLIVASAFIGAALLRVAGVATAWRARERLARGELPEQEMLEGLLIAVGGGLLMLPGFISDIFGILCLIPFTRRLMLGGLRRRVEQQALRRRAFADDLNARYGQGPSRPNVIEGEYERRDDSRN